jgi:hypothetical protein
MVWFMVFNANFNNISVISWLSVLLEEIGVPGENHRPVASQNIVEIGVKHHKPNHRFNNYFWK